MKIERVISDMLKENTGVAMMDSGGHYGRNHERNQKVVFKDTPKIEVGLWTQTDGTLEVSLTRSVYWYLIDNLNISETSEMLNKTFKDGCDKDTPYLSEMETFLEEINENEELNTKVYNTYNGEEFLSQTLQYGIFGFQDKTYIILQIHGGCDVRGGYTTPRVFELNEEYLTNDADFNSSDGYQTDDGYNWYDKNSDKVEINDIWYIKDNKLFNKKTNKEVVFT